MPRLNGKGRARRDAIRKLVRGAGAAVLAGTGAGSAMAAEPASAIRNIGLCVTDAARSKKFYVEAFGFTADSKPSKVGAALEPLMEAQGLDLTIQYIDTGGPRIEMFQYAAPKTIGDGQRRPMNQLGFTHIQVKVADLNATLAAVKRAGGTVLENTKLMRNGALQVMFVLDPDGTRIAVIP